MSGTGPSVDSDNQEERIAARRIRIAQRIEDSKNIGATSRMIETVSALDAVAHKSIAKIAQELEDLDILREQGMEKVTLVRITADMAESKSRRAEDGAKVERLRKLELENASCATALESIMSKWNDAMAKIDAGDLRLALEKQKGLCDNLIQGKDSLIAELQVELKHKDDEFVKVCALLAPSHTYTHTLSPFLVSFH